MIPASLSRRSEREAPGSGSPCRLTALRHSACMRVVIADDHRLMLDGIRRALEDDGGFEIVGETQDGTQVLSIVASTSPTSCSSTSACHAWTASPASTRSASGIPEIKVVMLSASTSPELVAAALRRGASAYLSKSVDPTDLPSTLRQVVEGNVWSASGDRHRGSGRRRQGAGTDGPRDRHPAGAGARPLERRDREGALGDAADGEVPPDEHLPEARRQEPDPGDPDRPPARPRREPALR